MKKNDIEKIFRKLDLKVRKNKRDTSHILMTIS